MRVRIFGVGVGGMTGGKTTMAKTSFALESGGGAWRKEWAGDQLLSSFSKRPSC